MYRNRSPRCTLKARRPGLTGTVREPMITTRSGRRELSGRWRTVGVNGPTETVDGYCGASQRGAWWVTRTEMRVPPARPSTIASGGVPDAPVATAPGPHPFDQKTWMPADL